ncbi:hypothetical protein F2Q68_00016607 [Brassica cretica]|uniref:Uncharacterized protein n=1 Tax=Brassica cretica TaxID=69181 RepID=A0A8S9HTA7_BRACR|nr:hypothetical protein F2Q68_00016607 [Brassica cretica]KAF3589103.1 hypothetical protein F2Q69_00030426 [Brassica cretica]
MDVDRCKGVDIGRDSCILYHLQSVSKTFKFELMSTSVAYASDEISFPWLFVSDIYDFTFGTSLPRFVGVASSIDVLL